jgi:phosphoribosylamine--glycine ligase
VSLFFVSDGDTVRALSPAQDFKRASTATRARTPAAWAPTPAALARRAVRQRGGVRRRGHPHRRRARHPQLDAEGTRSSACSTPASSSPPPACGHRVQRPLRRSRDPGRAAAPAQPAVALLLAAASGTLEDEPQPEFSDDAAITVVLASEGYPEAPQTGRPIEGLAEAAAVEGVGTCTPRRRARRTGRQPHRHRWPRAERRRDRSDFADARARAYEAIGRIHLDGAQYRTDIAARVAR